MSAIPQTTEVFTNIHVTDVDTCQEPDHEPNPRSSNFWSNIMFQRIFIFSLARLVIYLHKLYQDFGAVQTYKEEKSFYFSIISILSLILPSLIYAIYLSLENIIRSGNFYFKVFTTKFVNGALLMPWQIKRHLDGLYFASQRLCSFRPGNKTEMVNISYLNQTAEVLEFFEDFYAGFLQLVLQLYIFAMQANNLLSNSSLLIGEILGSALSIFSMLIAIRRRDDGILTGFLSFVGWVSMFVSRVAVFSLATTIIGAYISLFCFVHVIGFTIWIYGIAMESHKEEANPTPSTDLREVPESKRKNYFQIATLVFLFFGIPSLVLWPIMFQLKQRGRPLIFLTIITIENAILLSCWYFFKNSHTQTDYYSLILVIAATLMADIFLIGYYCLKPGLTDKVAITKMRFSGTDSFGIYYEFCDVVFRLKVSKQFRSDLAQVEKLVESL